MIYCESCCRQLISVFGLLTSSVFEVVDYKTRNGFVSKITCRCGDTVRLDGGGSGPPENTSEPKQAEETIQGQLAGVREFKVTEDGNLGGLAHGGAWEPDKPHRATCAKGEAIGLGSPGSYAIRVSSWDDHYAPRKPHDAPDYNCQCGFYSFHSLEEAEKAGDGFYFPYRLRAVVSAWGDVIICEHGFRAEWMQVEAIIKQPTFAWGAEIDASAAWDKIAARYSVPVLETSEVAEFCEALGTVVDGDAELYRAEKQRPYEQAERQQKVIESLNKLGKVMDETEEKQNKPAFWRDRLPNKKKRGGFGV